MVQASVLKKEELDSIKLTDLIDVATLQRIQDAFAKATGMAALTVDLDGPVTQLSNGTQFCMELTRQCPKGAERCNQCDLKGGEEARKTGRPSVYYCHGGLMDFAAPILLGNRQIGSMIGGQVLPVPGDENKFRRIARELGIDENAYIAALRKIRVVPKASIEAAAELLFVMANSLSQIGYQRLYTKKVAQDLIGAAHDLSGKIAQAKGGALTAGQGAQSLLGECGQLREAAKESTSYVAQTGEVLKYIKDVSLQTSLLGMNASIEAAHAGAYGKGFSVIAQDVKRLADTSSQQTRQIEQVLVKVGTSIGNVNQKVAGAYENLEGFSSTMGELTKLIDELGTYAARLEEFGKRLQ